MLDFERCVETHELLLRILERPPYEHRAREAPLVRECVRLESRCDVFAAEAVCRKLHRLLVDDVLHLREDGHAQGVHARTLHRVGVYEPCDELQEIVERRLVAGTILVVVGEEPDRQQVCPHAVRGVVEHEQLAQHPLREPLLAVYLLPEIQQDL